MYIYIMGITYKYDNNYGNNYGNKHGTDSIRKLGHNSYDIMDIEGSWRFTTFLAPSQS